jgi:hypothetical protein
MSDLLVAPIRETLWHKMRQDLAQYVPETAGNRLLMCCACGRFLPRECFDLEHLIPRQALRQDPVIVRSNPSTPANTRAGNILLCKKPLKHKGNEVHGNGCNSWKGRFYDRPISELASGKALQGGACTQVHIIAGLSLGYLAMVAQFGYVVALMRSGLLMREQFFSPYKYHPALPGRSQMLLGGSVPITSPEARMWASPFSFGFQRSGCCTVGARNFAVMIPISRDPRETFAHHLRIAPSKYKLRPDFRTAFN